LKIIKLNAIDSTNSFLKGLVAHSHVENFTTVIADFQENGRGQQGSAWVSEPYKNLISSTLVKFSGFDITKSRYLNFAVSLAIFETLSAVDIPGLAIKWPNDILSGNKKICGILIENSIKGTEISSAIIGIGLNINQTTFPSALTTASSLKLLKNKNFEIDVLLNAILFRLQSKITRLQEKGFKELEIKYLSVLYKKNIPAMFKDSKNTLFMGIVYGISIAGKLQVKLEDDSIAEFGIKEIAFI
jgi:BirA family biotin operon repressor/biotin-[acetyl-CoA-carboxylase] ligase